MDKSITDSFKAGSGNTVADDLQEAFQYLSKRLHLRSSKGEEYWWGDMYRKTYSGVLVDGSAQVPKSIFEFLTSVERKMIKVVQTYNEWGVLSRLAEQQEEEQDWENLGKTIETVNKASGRVEHLLWLAPKSVKRMGGGVSTIASISGELHGIATAYADGNLQGFAELRGATAVLEKLPILGAFYGSALATIPNIHKYYSALVQCRVTMIDKINPHLMTDFRDACQKQNKRY